MSKFIDFRAVKAAVSMEQILQRYGVLETLRGSGDSRRGKCPIHQGTNPDQFSVNLAKGVWNCFSDCKCGGNQLEFVAKMENVDVHAAALLVCEWFNLKPADVAGEDSPRERSRPAERAQSGKPPPPASPPNGGSPRRAVSSAPPEDDAPNKVLGFALKDLDPTHPYLAERGLTVETATDFGLGFFPAASGLMVGRIAIPIHNHTGKLVAYGGRWPGDPPADTPKYRLPPGFKKRLEVYNLHRVIGQPDEQPFLLVEGFFDCLKLWQLGARRVVALMGSSLSPQQEVLILQSTTSRTRIIVMLDEDEAGREARGDLAARLALHRFVRVHRFAEEGQQPEHLTAEQLAEVFA
jgi:DNA primase